MTLLSKVFGSRARGGAHGEALARWKSLPEFDRRRPAAAGRWVVVDVESSGLDATRAELLAIGALGVRDGEVDLADGFEVVLAQEVPSGNDNIEVHGIGATEQMGGEDPASALAAFLAFIGKDPLVAYHAPFDATLLGRAIRRRLGIGFDRPWLDLAEIAPLVWPGRVSAEAGLDGWIESFGIPMAHRHRAIVDCLATAQLFAAILPHVGRLEAASAGALLRLSGARRWLGSD